jgi:hypothetical protein
MALPTDFHFSASSLQDYADCPRRFQLRWIQGLAWPSVEAEPAEEFERLLQQGSAFHRLVQQHFSGIPLQRLERLAAGDNLRRWWRNYLESGLVDLPQMRYPEVDLSAPFGHYRLAAKYDLIAIDEGKRALIVDWKTAQRRPRREILAERLQTRIYPYLFVLAGHSLNGGAPLAPEQVEMIYWFAEFPAQPERFAYDPAQYDADSAYLGALIAEIEGLGDGDVPLTSDERRCRFCVYRSLCERGVVAGPLGEDEGESELAADFDLDFEQIAEVEY